MLELRFAEKCTSKKCLNSKMYLWKKCYLMKMDWDILIQCSGFLDVRNKKSRSIDELSTVWPLISTLYKIECLRSLGTLDLLTGSISLISRLSLPLPLNPFLLTYTRVSFNHHQKRIFYSLGKGRCFVSSGHFQSFIS